MSPELEAVALAAGTAAAAGLAGAAGTVWVARRSVAVATLLAPLVVVASVGAGVFVTARAMFLSEHDLALVSWVLLAAALVAPACGLLVFRAVRAVDRQATAEAAERRRATEVAETRREMVTWASHDLKSPLAGIRVMAEALEDGMVDDPDTYYRRIREQADRLDGMVNDLLALSDLNGVEVQPHRERVPLRSLAEQVVAGHQAVATARGVTLLLGDGDGGCARGSARGNADGDGGWREGVERRSATGGPDPTVRADPDQLHRVVTNLVGNALRHTPEGGRVQIDVARDGDQAVLRVADGCGGIPEGDLPRVFEPGWRGTAARTPGEAGAGVGLAIAQGLVALQRGTVEVVNTGPGCRFSVRLPALD